jgi:hypothetical protein
MIEKIPKHILDIIFSIRLFRIVFTLCLYSSNQKIPFDVTFLRNKYEVTYIKGLVLEFPKLARSENIIQNPNRALFLLIFFLILWTLASENILGVLFNYLLCYPY